MGPRGRSGGAIGAAVAFQRTRHACDCYWCGGDKVQAMRTSCGALAMRDEMAVFDGSVCKALDNSGRVDLA